MTRKKVYINFLPVAAGGGLQNALSFLSLYLSDPPEFDCQFIVREGGLLHKKCIASGVKTIFVANNFLSRLKFELFDHKKKLDANSVIFTLFGPPFLKQRAGYKNICGFAYSNILHTDIDFWGFLPPYLKVKKKIVDYFRLKFLLVADCIVFETQYLLDKAKKDRRFEGVETMTVVEMTPSKLVDKSLIDNERLNYYKGILGNGCSKKILYLSGSHPNKRHNLFIDVLKEVLGQGGKVSLILTLPDGDYLDEVMHKAKMEGIPKEYLINVGPVEQSDVVNLIDAVDFVVNFSLLESFSNNFVEAWVMEKPLLLADSEWARNSCFNAAFYLNPYLANEAAVSLLELQSNNSLIDSCVENGKKQLSQMPSREERYRSYLSIISSYL